MRSQSNRRILLVALIAVFAAMQVSRAADSNKPKGNDKPANVNKPERPGNDASGSANSGNGNSGNANGNGNSGKSEKNDTDLKSEFKAQADALQKKQKD